jgi:hypothetical protein
MLVVIPHEERTKSAWMRKATAPDAVSPARRSRTGSAYTRDSAGAGSAGQQWEGIQAALGQILGDQNDVHLLTGSRSDGLGGRGEQ